jgi:hypothetical protein
MSTQCIVAVPDGDSFRGRYVHSDGYPSWTGRFLRELVDRDGLNKVIATVVIDHPTGWSMIDPANTAAADPGTVVVPGYGIAYEDEPDQREWVTPDDGEMAEWAYVLAPSGIMVWQNDESWFQRPDLDLSLSAEELEELADQD